MGRRSVLTFGAPASSSPVGTERAPSDQSACGSDLRPTLDQRRRGEPYRPIRYLHPTQQHRLVPGLRAPTDDGLEVLVRAVAGEARSSSKRRL